MNKFKGKKTQIASRTISHLKTLNKKQIGINVNTNKFSFMTENQASSS